MMATYLRLLGPARAEYQGRSVVFQPDLRFLLLAYLACRGDWVSRDHLTFLFWPDIPGPEARTKLRHLLSRARALGFAPLEGEDEQVRWLVESDVMQFQGALGQGDWGRAVRLYRGRLLEGINPEFPDYDDWLRQEQEGLQNAYRQALLNHSQALEAQGRPAEAHALLGVALKGDLLAEDLVQAYLRTAARSGVRAEALKGYEAFRHLLEQELGLEPLETTRQLAEALRQSPAPEPPGVPGRPTLTAVGAEEAQKLRNFPPQLTAFVGRDLDLSEIAGFFREPGIRLLTLVGPGGIGKTRLAVQVGLEQARRFREGAAFVPLASTALPEALAPAIAGALGLELSPKPSPEEQLKAHLQDQELLLILDNLEHLLPGAGLISELLGAAPALRVLVTSREALDFHGEYLVEVAGMDVPPALDDERIEIYDAVQLFVRSARRLNPRFGLGPENKPQVARICRMLGGSPLAIELATSWIRLLSVEEVGEEIGKSLDFLRVNQPDLPERHRSLRAVFEHSWNLLSAEEQTALMRLSAFRGGFRKEAAEAVAGVSLRTLLTLTNKSLLQRTPQGRFQRHATVREFSEEKLAGSQILHAIQQERHGLYFFDFLEARVMGGPHDQGYLAELEEELENLRAAWGWAVEYQRADQLERSTDLVVFYDRRARFEEGANLFREAVEALSPANPQHHAALGKACVDSAWLYRRMGRLDRAREYTTQAVELLRGSDSPTLMKALNLLGEIYRDTGDKDQARGYLSEALALARKLRNIRAQSNYLNNLGQLEQLAGNYQQAGEHLKEVLILQEQNNNLFERVMTLNNLGRLELAMLNLSRATTHLQEALQIATNIGYRFSIPYLLSNLGGVAYQAREYTRAGDLCLEALQVMESNADPLVKATVYMTLGRTATATGNLAEAAQYFRKSLEIVWPIQELPVVMENLVGLAELNFKLGNMDMTLELLDLVISHPATEPWFKRDAEELLGSLPKERTRVKASEVTDQMLTDLLQRILA